MFASGSFQLSSASLAQTSSYANLCWPCGNVVCKSKSAPVAWEKT